MSRTHGESHQNRGEDQFSGSKEHAGSLGGIETRHKPRSSAQAGFALLEVTVALALLVVIGMVMLKLSLNVVYPRQWMMQQSLTDAYLSGERARAERISFSDLNQDDASVSLWTTTANTTDDVLLGKLPGGKEVTGSVTRVMTADSNNPENGNLHEDENPAAMKIWKLESTLKYTIGGRNYEKSRTIIRMQ
ncbi:prepilin-type N-terminal cleavage/methylation domain-containing protein [Luteolibacter pohnpeiensis]|uniref:Prepilin-type N-terminal cleavage/methylation domain-containing protein n=1 Tax=Luteolibacter pohnpeiensis TaxID=454153 RepID=A0A934VUT8_9BACT|nr:prepilin-type N-terminal cleavage/methylation domain-containing protein [Luteolibacter pohnpeiensis]MBK1880849.1 prepilin-type N-terminal cleavage/methylation domain-containing protein [Luteolibacter pohnpeiensis]